VIALDGHRAAHVPCAFTPRIFFSFLERRVRGCTISAARSTRHLRGCRSLALGVESSMT